jgi:uncharacterized membrane protein YjjB (DUF3815 family)
MTSTPGRRDRRTIASSIVAAIGFVLLPKCPLCIAAYLVSLGLGAEAASGAAPMIRPIVSVALAASLIALFATAWRRRRRAPVVTATCCGMRRAYARNAA